MPNSINLAPPTLNLFDHPLLYPVNVVLKPIVWICSKVAQVFQSFMGYFLQIGVFSFGAWNRSWIKRQIINLYKGGCFDTLNRKTFDPSRLERACAVMQNIGGIRSFTYSKDGTKLDTMIVRYQDVKRTIQQYDGKIVDAFPITIDNVVPLQAPNDKETRYICHEDQSKPEYYADILVPAFEGEVWKSFYDSTLKNLGLKQIKLTLKNGDVVEGFVLKHWREKNPIRPKEGQCFIRCNAPTESYPMAKRDIMRHVLGIRSDMICFDYPGTMHSQNVPKEGRYYLAAETMVEKAVSEYGYAWENIWATGFCLGGSIAIHLKRKYHEMGINLFIQNTFDSLKNTIKNQIFPASHIAHFGIDEAKSVDPFVCELTQQDGFDNLEKFRSLERKEKKGISIIVHTDTDKTIQPNSHELLSNAAKQVSKKTFSILFPHLDHSVNGHSYDVLSDRRTWDRVVNFMTSKDYPQVLRNINLLGPFNRLFV